TDHDWRAHQRLPRAEVPPFHIAVVQAVFRRTPICLVAVDEVEPVVARRERALDAVDLLYVPAGIARANVGNAVEGLHRRQPGGHSPLQYHLSASVAGHPESSLAVLRAAAAYEGRGGEYEEDTLHRSAVDLTAP